MGSSLLLEADATAANVSQFSKLEIPLSILIIVVYILAGYAINQYKRRYMTAPWIHESAVAAILGVAVGGFLKYKDGYAITFDNNVFFRLVLPPVILSAGYTLRRRNFFRYMHIISLFGIVGTLLNFIILTLSAYLFARLFDGTNELVSELPFHHCMLLAAVLSASDEVSAMSLVRMKEFPRMGALIFGEGVINDALSIVIFKVLLDWYPKNTATDHLDSSESKTSAVLSDSASYDYDFGINVAVGIISTVMFQIFASCVIGLLVGLMNARILKTLPDLRKHPVHQTALVLLSGYLAYFIAEAFDISGILTILIAAITLAHYSWHSLSKTSQLTTKISFQSLSDIAEAFAFCYVGLSLWSYTKDRYSLIFAFFMLVVVVLGRFFTVFMLCILCKLAGKEILPFNEQCAFAAAGIVRGCLCWAQVLQISTLGSNDAHHDVLITTTLILVMSTTIGCGILLPIFIPRLIKPSLPTSSPHPLTASRLVSTSLSVYNHGYDSCPAGGDEWKEGAKPKSKDDSTFSTHLPSDELTSPCPEHRGSGENSGTSYAYAVLYLFWIRLDETLMKPYFGGSEADDMRIYLLESTKTMTVYSIITSSSQRDLIKRIINVGVDIQANTPVRHNATSSASNGLFTPIPKAVRDSVLDVSDMTTPASRILMSEGIRNTAVSSGDVELYSPVANLDEDDDLFLKDEAVLTKECSPIYSRFDHCYDNHGASIRNIALYDNDVCSVLSPTKQNEGSRLVPK